MSKFGTRSRKGSCTILHQQSRRGISRSFRAPPSAAVCALRSGVRSLPLIAGASPPCRRPPCKLIARHGTGPGAPCRLAEVARGARPSGSARVLARRGAVSLMLCKLLVAWAASACNDGTSGDASQSAADSENLEVWHQVEARHGDRRLDRGNRSHRRRRWRALTRQQL